MIQSVASLGGAARHGCHYFGVRPYYDVKHNSTDLWWIPFFLLCFVPYPHLDRKPIDFAAKTISFLVFTYFWTENPLILQRRPFFLVLNYFWTQKGCHREIPPRMPPSLATPLGPMFLWISLNSCPLNLVLVQSHQAEKTVVKRLVQGRHNVIRIWVKPRSRDQNRCKSDAFSLSAALPTNCSKSKSIHYGALFLNFRFSYHEPMLKRRLLLPPKSAISEAFINNFNIATISL